jgi:hypothetical protein
MTRPKQRVILYRHGLRNKTAENKAAREAIKYREKRTATEGRVYFACPGGCGKQVSLGKTNKVSSHYSDQKNKTPCLFKGELP